MVNIVKNLVPSNKYNIKCPFSMIPTRIVVHNTANNASARNEIKYMINNDNEVSYHYAVDDIEIIQGILENRNSWHCGDGNGPGNREGIAIEICYSTGNISKFLKAENNAVELIVDILKRYNWSIEKVTKHQDYSGKYCPHKTLDLGWDRFINLIKNKLEDTKPFNIGDTVYNSEDLYLYETAGYGGINKLLKKNTKSIVKLYHFNKDLYFALGNNNGYYTAAWTKEINKFSKNEIDTEDNNSNGTSDTNTSNNSNESNNEVTSKNIIKLVIDLVIKFIKHIIKLFIKRKV